MEAAETSARVTRTKELIKQLIKHEGTEKRRNGVVVIFWLFESVNELTLRGSPLLRFRFSVLYVCPC